MERGEAAAPAPLLHDYECSVSSDESVLNAVEHKKNLLACQGDCNGDCNGGALLNDAITQTLLKPLGMNHTSFRMITENLAAGYSDGQPVPPMEANITATGGAYSTVNDMAQLLIMLLKKGLHPNGNRILRPDTVALMGQTETSPSTSIRT